MVFENRSKYNIECNKISIKTHYICMFYLRRSKVCKFMKQKGHIGLLGNIKINNHLMDKLRLPDSII